MSKRTLGWLLAVIVVVGGIYAINRRTPSGPPASSGSVKIGVILPLSGDAAPYGLPIRRTIEMAVAEVNTAGGINGKPVDVVWGDGKCNGPDAVTEVQKLVSVDGAKVIFGGACSGETIPLAPITEAAQVLLVSPCASSPKISEIGDFVFRTYPSDAFAGRVAAEYAAKVMGAKKVALITEQTDDAQGLRNAFKVTFGQYGGAVTADEVYQTGTTDFRTQLLKVKGANPDVVYLVPQTGTSGLRILQQLRDLGYRGKRLTANVLLDRKLVQENARLMEGVIGVEAALDIADSNVAAFLGKYRAQYGEDLSGIPLCGANGYTQVHLLNAAVRAVGNDTAKIRDWLYGLKDWQGPLGTLTFDRNGDSITGSFGVRSATAGQVRTLGTQRLMDGNLEAFVPSK